MKRLIGIIFVGLLFFSFVSAESVLQITGRVIDNLEYDVSQMSEEELLQLYEKNKDSFTEEEINKAIEEYGNEIPEEILKTYEDNQDVLMDFEFNESVLEDLKIGTFLNMFPCSLMNGFIEDQVVGTEIPEEIPLDNEFFDFYVDDEFFIALEIRDKKIEGLYCDESEDVGFQIFVTSELITDVVLNYEEIDPVEFYKENKKSGDLDIKAKGLKNRFKLFVLNIGMKFL